MAITRRNLIRGLAGAVAVPVAVASNMLAGQREKPTKLEPGQVWRHKPGPNGVNVIIIIGPAVGDGHELAEFWPDWEDQNGENGVLLTGEDCGASDEDILRAFDYVYSLDDLGDTR